MFKMITTGYFYADGGAMFGAIPKVAWSRSYPADERNLCVLAMHTGVVKTVAGRVIIVDPGVGRDQLKSPPAVYYRFYDVKDLYDELKQIDIKPEEVTDVIFTHLHFDHCGAAVRKNANGTPEPAFPNAAHWVSRAQYECERRPHPLEADSFMPENTGILEKAGLLRLVEATIEPCDGLRMQLYDGHTLGQIAVSIETASLFRNEASFTNTPSSATAPGAGITDGCAAPNDKDLTTIVFPGDILPLASHIVPERISAYDLYPTLSYNGKREILETASSGKQLLVFFHDAYTPCATIKKRRERFVLSPLPISHS
ncbi:MAG: MBL fold metallo-hydrolase [Tannerella sp.]|jgi:glyoxylase-like metal-dependent hydrolase (beta-lactamase superfamily II)|nr:MBL fold metallo-hydrolase [Tannerella sp.]